jgi:hypothetical protein
LNDGATWNASAIVAATASHAKTNKLPGRRILDCFCIAEPAIAESLVKSPSRSGGLFSAKKKGEKNSFLPF